MIRKKTVERIMKNKILSEKEKLKWG